MANDSEAGVKEILYSIDKSDHQPYSQPFSISEDGVHIIDITALDNVDNTNNDKLIVFTDNKGPEIYTLFTTSPRDFIVRDNSKIPVYPSFVGLFVSATDPYSGYDKMFYSINGSPEKQFSGYISNFKGDTKITITCYDRLGNTSKTQIEFVVKD